MGGNFNIEGLGDLEGLKEQMQNEGEKQDNENKGDL